MIPIDGEQRRTLKDCGGYLRNHLTTTRNQVETTTGGHGLPLGPVMHFENQLGVLDEALGPDDQGNAQVELEDAMAPLVKALAGFGRRRLADDLATRRDAVVDTDLLASMDNRLARFDVLLAIPGVRAARPLRVPRASDFLRPHLTGISPTPQINTATEPKFRILLSPEHLEAALGEYRRHCDARRAPLAVAFLDIDNFKRFNTEYGEIRVDRDLLPKFFRTIDRGVFGHGAAYRHGGDECVLLLPGSPKAVALAILKGIQANLRNTEYPGITDGPTVSFGLCVVDPDSPMTSGEALSRAAWAKKQAKLEGKNRVVVAVNPELGEFAESADGEPR